MDQKWQWRVDLHWLLNWLVFLLGWVFSRPGRHLACWIGVVFLGGYLVTTAWKANGHITCDFAGQWLMGRMYFRHRGPELYLNVPLPQNIEKGLAEGKTLEEVRHSTQKDLLGEGYKLGEETFQQTVQTVENGAARKTLQDKTYENYLKMVQDILDKNVDTKTGDITVEGALYPPTAGLIFWPFAVMPPQPSHAVLVCLYGLCALLNGWCISRITLGRLQWGEAVLVILACPNSLQEFLLCQNAMLSLTILCTGWYFLHRGKPFLAGLIWGGFAFKPVFALSLLLVPILLPNRRMLTGMVSGGILFCLATLPFTGLQGLERLPAKLLSRPAQPATLPIKVPLEDAVQMNPWERWLIVGKNAAYIYSYDSNWVWMSRDIVGLPRRCIWHREGMEHNWSYLFERYFQGRDLWVAAKDKEQEDQWNAEWQNYHQKVYWGEKWQTETERAEVAGLMLLMGFILLTILIGAGTWGLRAWKGLPPVSQSAGCRPAFLLLGGVMSCWHFMHYDLILCSLPVCLLLAEFTRLSWPRWPWLVIALAALTLLHAALGLEQSLIAYLLDNIGNYFSLWTPFVRNMETLLGQHWWLWLMLLTQLGFGLGGLLLFLRTRRWSWLVLVGVVMLQLVTVIIGGLALRQCEAQYAESITHQIQGMALVLPLLTMLILFHERLWMLLLVGLFLLTNWDMAQANGITRFPFETVLAVCLWIFAGVMTLKRMRCREPVEGTPPTIPT